MYLLGDLNNKFNLDTDAFALSSDNNMEIIILGCSINEKMKNKKIMFVYPL